MSGYPETFAEISEKRGNLEAIWEWIGEGWDGDYDKDDPDDTPLLRFSVMKDGEQLDDASYCTRMPIDSPEWMLRRALEILLDVAESETSPKRRFEELSWFEPADFETVPGSRDDRKES